MLYGLILAAGRGGSEGEQEPRGQGNGARQIIRFIPSSSLADIFRRCPVIVNPHRHQHRHQHGKLRKRCFVLVRATVSLTSACRCVVCPGMSEHDLRHLAVITGTAPEHPEDIGRAVLASCDKAAEIAREAFALVPGLRAFSWLDPGLDSLLSRAAAPVAARACAAGARALATVAADLGISLRLCGRTDDLPGAALGQPARCAGRPDAALVSALQRARRDRPCRRTLSCGASRHGHSPTTNLTPGWTRRASPTRTCCSTSADPSNRGTCCSGRGPTPKSATPRNR